MVWNIINKIKYVLICILLYITLKPTYKENMELKNIKTIDEFITETKIKYEKGPCMRLATAKLLNLDPDSVPNFRDYDNSWIQLIEYVKSHGYDVEWFLYNRNISEYKDIHPFYDIENLKKHKGVNGLFIASVYSPKYNPPYTHAVLIDGDFNIVDVNSVVYKQTQIFPLADEIGYNGIKTVLIINEKNNGNN